MPVWPTTIQKSPWPTSTWSVWSIASSESSMWPTVKSIWLSATTRWCDLLTTISMLAICSLSNCFILMKYDFMWGRKNRTRVVVISCPDWLKIQYTQWFYIDVIISAEIPQVFRIQEIITSRFEFGPSDGLAVANLFNNCKVDIDGFSLWPIHISCCTLECAPPFLQR